MKIQPAAIKSFISNIPSNIKVVLCYGQDIGLITEYSNTIAKNFLGEEYNNSQVITIFGNTLKDTPEKFDEEVYTISMFDSNQKVIMIRDANEVVTKIIKQYIQNPSEDCLVVIQGDDYPPSSALRKLCDSDNNIASIACYVDNEATLKQIINDSLKENNFTISQDAIVYLISNLGNDRGVTRQEINKLILYKYDSKNITIEDVSEVVVNNSSSFLDKFVYSFFNKEITEAYRYLNILLEDQNAITIIRILAYHLQRLYQSKTKVNLGYSIEVAIKELKPAIFFMRVNEFKNQIRQWSERDIQQLYEILLKAEITAKSFSMTGNLLLKHIVLQYSTRHYN